MTNITLDKTWNVINCQVDTSMFTTSASQNAQAVFLLKEAFKTAGWTVSQSCDKITVNTTSDILTSSDNIVWAATGAHSWFVMKKTSLGGNFSVCFDFVGSPTYNYTWIVTTNYNGFNTDGTTSTRPTAVSGSAECVFASANYLYNTARSNNGKGYVLLYSSDGECFRAFDGGGNSANVYGSAGGSVFIFDKLKNAPSWFTRNVVSVVLPYTTNGGFNYGVVNSISNQLLKCDVSSNVVNCSMATIGLGDALGNTDAAKSCANYNGEVIITPAYAVSLNASYPGLLGSFYDLYLIPKNMGEGMYLSTNGFVKGLITIGKGAFGCSGNEVCIP